jgi:hypothetical protein
VHAELDEQVLHVRAGRTPVRTKLIGYLFGAQPIHDAAQHYVEQARVRLVLAG